jgi:hypothetical protein
VAGSRVGLGCFCVGGQHAVVLEWAIGDSENFGRQILKCGRRNTETKQADAGSVESISIPYLARMVGEAKE